MNLQQLEIIDLDHDKARGKINASNFPNECPICHNKIEPLYQTGFLKKVSYNKEVELIFLCPVSSCREVFIAYYTAYTPAHQSERFNLKKTAPKEVSPVKFSDIVENISPSFSKIYNQANSAEAMGLVDICGAGYRKSLEFLIKDYLISLDPEEVEKIKNEQLGISIKNRVEHKQLNEVAKRAAWLGNDETHYERRWDQKELKDLKLLIDLTVRWIETDKITEEIVTDMSE